jgi:hypothetical protein
MARTIQLNGNDRHQVQFVDLDGRTYGLELRWNERSNRWMLALRDSADRLMCAPEPLVVGTPMFARHNGKSLPLGILVAVDLQSGPNDEGAIDPGLGDLGTRVVLIYIELADIYG